MTDTRLFAICASAITGGIAAAISGLAAFVLVGVVYTHRATTHAQAPAAVDVYGYAAAIGISIAVLVGFFVARPVYRLLSFRDGSFRERD